MIREVNEEFVDMLKTEILEKPLLFLDPLICLVLNCATSKEFKTDDLSSYQYATLGGNHRRCALQKLLSEEEEMVPKSIPARLVFSK